MEIKDLLGELYTDEIANKLKDAKFVDLNDGQYISKAKYEGEKKDLIDKYNALNAEKVKAEEDYKKSQMSAEEIKAKELADIQNELKMNRIERNEMEVRSLFAQAGIAEEDYKDMLPTIVSENKEETKTMANSVISMLNKQKASVEQRVKEEMLKNTPYPPTGNSDNGAVTKEQFDKFTAQEMREFKESNPELFAQYIK